ncbi:hypothetical protein UAW_00060 [Enterococcus haemoperoxidus ATCC BAA-382]|uniref:Uncharacterized protein n=1 Tax=Enterococcus haemoperoxidus ATCC BAA-382 TaxID=1158608 RepID=R2T021_9ENTE|nr:hypothetical protein [Enterococcus haemoperoxidus]EOI00793.1 hypothetical protein UAW_00060 [Enterococcus haemoperoxidus ATCC BAA-382]EOT62027.1 hypothetical protein I583_01027 [Enterococcus haemoperoxidus ATCC BAA-382]OJG52079.1 hypothetical protein RV06_GL001094 [Enterococcus haemoperoxidus]
MEQTVTKVTTSFHNTWLVDLKKDHFSEENEILFGDTLRLSIAKNDSYFFSEAIALTYNKEVLSKETPTASEIAFFNYMKTAQEKAFSKSLATKYNLEQYLVSTPSDEVIK